MKSFVILQDSYVVPSKVGLAPCCLSTVDLTDEQTRRVLVAANTSREAVMMRMLFVRQLKTRKTIRGSKVYS